MLLFLLLCFRNSLKLRNLTLFVCRPLDRQIIILTYRFFGVKASEQLSFRLFSAPSTLRKPSAEPARRPRLPIEGVAKLLLTIATRKTFQKLSGKIPKDSPNPPTSTWLTATKKTGVKLRSSAPADAMEVTINNTYPTVCLACRHSRVSHARQNEIIDSTIPEWNPPM